MFRRVHNYNKILFARNFYHLTVPLGVTRALLLVDSKWQMTGWTKCREIRYGSSLYPYACGRKRAPRSEHFQFFWATLMSTLLLPSSHLRLPTPLRTVHIEAEGSP